MTLRRLPHNALYLKTPISTSDKALRDIKVMCHRIMSAGLLNPLIVSKQQDRFVIVDGKKRFLAIQVLAHNNKLPRSLSKIPCLVTSDAALKAPVPHAPALMDQQDLVHNIIAAAQDGLTNAQIKYRYACSDDIISQALSVQNLHPKLKIAFCKGTLNLKQAAAFATLPNLQSQWELLIKLGPFASDAHIIKAIAIGSTVIQMSGGDVIILPSRARRPALPPATYRHLAIAA